MNKCCNKCSDDKYVDITDLTPEDIGAGSYLIGVNQDGELAAFNAAAGGGMVDDVIVNGESAVIDRIAYIDLPDYNSIIEDLSNLESNISNETIRSQQAESLLSSKIDAVNTDLSTEIQRSIDSDQALGQSVDGINSKINQNVITNLNYTESATGIIRNRTFKNLYTGIESTTAESMPIVSNTTAGIVLPDVFNTINENTNRITNLEANTSADLTTQPTKADLDAWPLPPNAKQGDTANVRADETEGGASTRYKLDSNLNWVLDIVYGAPTPQATNTTLGTVKGSLNNGQVAVETDGSMSVVGFDELKNSIPTDLSQLTNSPGYITNEDVNITDATTTVKGIATLGSTSGAARYGHKEDVELSNVDNTSDLDKPLSYAAEEALYNKRDLVYSSNAVYTVNQNMAQTYLPYDNDSGLIAENNIVRRKYGGNIQVPFMVEGVNAVGYAQVNEMVEERQMKLTDVDDILFVQEVPANPNPRILYLTPIS